MGLHAAIDRMGSINDAVQGDDDKRDGKEEAEDHSSKLSENQKNGKAYSLKFNPR